MNDRFAWWNNLRHGGLFLDAQRLTNLIAEDPPSLNSYDQDRLRRRLTTFEDDPGEQRGKFIGFVMEAICGFSRPAGEWYRASEVKTDWSRRMITGESVRPRHLWIGKNGAKFPVFIDDQARLGVGRGKRIISHALQWLRQGDEQLALITNGHQWRLLFAGLDYEAFCEWDVSGWFSEGEPSPELMGLRVLFDPTLWTPEKEGEPCPLLAAINDSRKGQADLSQVLGERVRQAVELLVQGHAAALNPLKEEITAEDTYRAGVRVIMRMVVALFAESREGLLPRDNPIYHNAYSLQGLREQLERTAAYRLRSCFAAWPRVLALFRLIHEGSSHEALVVPTYDGELFAAGESNSADGMRRALTVFENACFQHDIMTDAQVREILDLLTRTKVRIRQGRASTWVPAPVDFSSLDSEYIGILYEGLLDFELRTAPNDQPIIFLAVGNQPALPLATLESMDNNAIKNLLEKMKDTSSGEDEEDEDEAVAEDELGDEGVEGEVDEDIDATDESSDDESGAPDDVRHTTRTRAEAWARRASEVGKLVSKPRGKMTPEKKLRYEADLDRKARQITTRVVLPGEWYLVRWGGTRKGSGTFYTRPQLAVPTAHRTLRPLAYDPPRGKDGHPDDDAPVEHWTPKSPERILSLKVCDPACGSGSFPLAALRFLTEALYASLHTHDRIRDHGGRAMIDLIRDHESTDQTLASETLPCRPEDDDFESRTKAVIRRYVAERCIYGVDLDPLAVELCRLSLWIETLDPRLPFTFLDHKIKCGNSLIGTWFDQFLHYPAMAWLREGGDKSHTNGFHFKKEEWTKSIKSRVQQVKKELIDFIDGAKLIYKVDLTTVQTVHDAAEAALQDIHSLGIHETNERARRYFELRQGEDFRGVKDAFDLWCSLWFWPAEQVALAPMPFDLAKNAIPDEAREIARMIASERHFFHWEIEFPDVFGSHSHGFDALLGNPPWDIAKPNSKEFFSAIDPLYRSYGKQEALQKQKAAFESKEKTERDWLTYNAGFRAQTNWVKFSGHSFGNRVTRDSNGKPKHDFSLGDRGRSSFDTSQARHDKWQQKREETSGYADAEHVFRHQGGGDLNLYKLFLEQAHALLREGGRLGFIVPSGVYSDKGTGRLRTLFLTQCRWEWIFGFINTLSDGSKVFDIHPSQKFNPVIVQKGGQTEYIRTSFMRRNLADWERGEAFATDYPRKQVIQFSPRSNVVLEIQSRRDLDVLSRIYCDSTLLGDDSEGWGIRYATEFHMTNDSKLFPPRDKWEENGYRPDEYSRWIKGEWRERSDDSPAPPHCRRVDIRPGIVLSREGTHYICESEIHSEAFKDKKNNVVDGPAVLLPLYEGRMIGQFDFSAKGWVSGRGRSAKWRAIPWEQKEIDPQFLMGQPLFEKLLLDEYLSGIKASAGEDARHAEEERLSEEAEFAQWRLRFLRRHVFMDVSAATNTRTMIAALIGYGPSGNKTPLLLPTVDSRGALPALNAIVNSMTFDFQLRNRLAGTTLNWFIVEETAVPKVGACEHARSWLSRAALALSAVERTQTLWWLTSVASPTTGWKQQWAVTPHERVRLRCMAEAIVATMFGLDAEDFRWIVAQCDYPLSFISDGDNSGILPAKGFWRIDKHKPPEQRLTVLSLLATIELRSHIDRFNGNVSEGLAAFCQQNEGDGWMIPETLRLDDYGLGHDDRAKQYQPVRDCFGPRFYDWQLDDDAEESWRECHLHARNLLGPDGYKALLDEIEGRVPPLKGRSHKGGQEQLFETEHLPLFDQ